MTTQVSDDELDQWAKYRADDAGRLARELIGYRHREFVGIADHTRLVKEAVEAEHNRCVDAIKNARARNTKIGSVEWALACEMIAAIRSRGVKP